MIPTKSSSSQPFPRGIVCESSWPCPPCGTQKCPQQPHCQEETAVTGRVPERGWWVMDMEIQTQLCWTQNPHVLLSDLLSHGLGAAGSPCR